jgi:hypothetical protein
VDGGVGIGDEELVLDVEKVGDTLVGGTGRGLSLLP